MTSHASMAKRSGELTVEIRINQGSILEDASHS
jgi:hypothetical protein